MSTQFGHWIGAALLAFSATAAAELRFSSGPAQTVMIELFTSEGCSSCPPAETYLNGYANHPELWTRFVPMAFHVDYWNYLGWEDRFATPANTQRQHRYARARNLRVVYTPAFVVNGQEWQRGWFSKGPPPANGNPGMLAITLNGKTAQATFAPRGELHGPLDLHLALLGMGLHTDIRSGENKGRRAEHHFVVLAKTQLRSENLRWQGTFPSGVEKSGASRYALVAWVSRADDPTPLQALGGYLPQTP